MTGLPRMTTRKKADVRMEDVDTQGMLTDKESLGTTFVPSNDGVERYADSGAESDYGEGSDSDRYSRSNRGLNPYGRGASGVWARGSMGKMQAVAVRLGMMPNPGEFGGWDSDSLGGWAGGWGNDDGIREHESLDFDPVQFLSFPPLVCMWVRRWTRRLGQPGRSE